MTEPSEGGGAAALTAGLLAQEDDLHRQGPPAPLDRDHQLGANEGDLTLRAGLAKGGLFTFVVLLVLNSLDELESAALTVLGPDIADTLHMSDGAMIFITSVAAAFFVVGAVPLGWLADRGHFVTVCYTWEAAADTLERYLRGRIVKGEA